MIRRKLWNPFISSALTFGSPINWRLHGNRFHNVQRKRYLEHQREQTDENYHLLGSIPPNAQDVKPFRKGCVKSTKQKIKEQVDMMELIGHRDTITHEKIITKNPSLYEKKNLTFEERVKEMKADIEDLKRASEELKKGSEKSKRALEKSKRASDESKRASDESKKALEELKRASEESKRVADQTIRMLEIEKEKRYKGETVNMRRRLWRMVFTKKEHGQQIPEPDWMEGFRRERNHLAHQTDLGTVMKLADDHPKFYDILLDTIYGVPKQEIKLLLEADKTGENQVYNILDERGSAFHNHFANTCVTAFNMWLSAVRSLEDIQSASANKQSSDHENCVQKQKAEVQRSIREWHAAFIMDSSKRDGKIKKCRELILKDYTDRGLLPKIKKSLLCAMKKQKGSGGQGDKVEGRGEE